MFDSYLERGVRPYVQIGFMPRALSSNPEPYRHEWRPGFPYDRIFTGWSYPPKDYEKWGELAYQWAKHCVERYGREEVESWYWQAWNEANIGGPGRPGYFTGSVEEFHKLHDYAIAGVRRALPTARVGGADSAGSGGNWTRRFFEHCLRGTNYATGEVGTPLDFVSFHAKGSPRWVEDHIRMGIANQLRTIDDGFGIVASFPELKNTPIIIGESDPEGCAACQGAQFSYRNGTMYSSYTAASFARKHDLADRHGVNFEGALTWAFTFEDQPYFAGFRQLASNGLPLPVFNVIRMFSRMSGDRVMAESSGAMALDEMMREGVRDDPDVAAFASFDEAGKRLAVMVWHYHDDDLPGPDAAVEMALSGLPVSVSEAKLTHFRIDQDHSNAYSEWLRMGSPVAPNLREYRRLQEVSELGRLTDSPGTAAVAQGIAKVNFNLPRQGVSLLLLEW
jgi:xylan 1,4-beta-xylosidase